MKFGYKIGMFCLGALLASGVSAEILYWQVTTDSQQQFNYAQLHVIDASATSGEAVDTTIARASVNKLLATATSDGGSPYSSTTIQQTDLGTYNSSTYSFYVELVNYSNGTVESVGKGAVWNYNDLSAYIANDALTANAARAALQSSSGLSMGSIPEPTSGLLLLMGGAMLALRRRRRV